MRLGSADGRCGVAFDELLEKVWLDECDKPLLNGVGAEGQTKRVEEEGKFCSSVVKSVDCSCKKLSAKAVAWR